MSVNVLPKSEIAAKRSSYIPALDGLRCIAIVGVLLQHFSYGKFHGGFIGVDLFFALSGFLITSLLLSEFKLSGRISLRKFYTRRALRLLPVLFTCLLVANIFWEYVAPPGASRAIGTLASLFYFANFVFSPLLGPFDILWSLSVEEHFYMLWPAIAAAAVFKKEFRKQVVILLSILIVLVPLRGLFCHYYGLHWRLGIFEIAAYRFTFFRMDTIFFGAIAAILMSHFADRAKIAPWNKILLAALSIFLCTMVFVQQTQFMYYIGFEIVGILCTILVVAASQCPENKLLANKVMLWVGRRSYGMYVYHLVIKNATEHLRVDHSMKNFLIVFLLRTILIVIAAALSFRFIEAPVLKLKSKFEVVSSSV